MATLNELSSRITHLVNQPHNHALKERMKDVIKSMFDNRIRQSVEKHGIDNNLKLTFGVDVINTSLNTIISGSQAPIEYNVKISKNKIPTPLRIHNDAPFMSVIEYRRGKVFQYENSLTAMKLRESGRSTFRPIGGVRTYTLMNNYLVLKASDYNFFRELSNVLITGIFENPDEVLNLYNTEDGQDLELPLPSDMIEEIIATILKVEFNLIPKDDDIKFVANSPIITNKTK